MVLVGIGVLLIGAAWQSRFVERMLENRAAVISISAPARALAVRGNAAASQRVHHFLRADHGEERRMATSTTFVVQ